LSPKVSVKLPNKLNRWHRIAAVALLDGALLLLLFNLLLYLASLAKRPSQPPWKVAGSPTLMKTYPGWREEDLRTLLGETWGRGSAWLEYEPFTGFKEQPFRGKYLNIDPAGFRFSKDQAPWPPRSDAINVFVFGGSTTYGYGLPDDQTIPSYLGECAAASDSPARLAVYNFAREGYFSTQERILFEQLLTAQFVPKLAVFIDGINEFTHPDGQPAFADTLSRFMAGQIHSNPLSNLPMIKAANRLRARWRKPPPRTPDDVADRAVLEGVIDRWQANKKIIKAVGAAFGVRTVFVWQPVPTYRYDLRYYFPTFEGGYGGKWPREHYGYPLMENLRAQGQLGPDVLWLADLQQDKQENLYVDPVHYTAAFSKEIAGEICGFLGKPPNGR
jgi:hypothetical protein